MAFSLSLSLNGEEIYNYPRFLEEVIALQKRTKNNFKNVCKVNTLFPRRYRNIYMYATDCETYNELLIKYSKENILFFNFCIAYCTSSMLELKAVFSRALPALNDDGLVSVQQECFSIDFQLNWQNDHFCCVSWLVLVNADD